MVQTIGGTGHRFIPVPELNTVLRIHGKVEQLLFELLIERFQKNKPGHFIGGGALGFDMVATEAAWQLRIPYTLALPFMGYNKRWLHEDRRRMMNLILNANRVHYVSGPGFAAYKMMRRNKWVIDHADCITALWSGKKDGGTAQAVMYAWSRRKPVDNLWRDFLQLADSRLL